MTRPVNQFCTEGNYNFTACVAFVLISYIRVMFVFISCASVFSIGCIIFFNHTFFKIWLILQICLDHFPILTFSIDVDDLYAVLRDSLKKTRRRGEMNGNQKVYFCRTNATE